MPKLKKTQNVAVSTPRPSKYESRQQHQTAASQFSSLQNGGKWPTHALAHVCICDYARTTTFELNDVRLRYLETWLILTQSTTSSKVKVSHRSKFKVKVQCHRRKTT